MIRVGINGFGRIGRNIFRAGFGRAGIEFVAVNDLPVGTKTLAYLLKHDSNFGEFKHRVETTEDALVVDGKTVKVFSAKSPEDLPWNSVGVDLVIESTGLFTEAEKARGHLKSGPKAVIISAPAKNEDATFVMGVNEQTYDPAKHKVVSNASCTTNCLGPVAKVLVDHFGVKHGFMTTIHSYTNDQRILDLAHKDLRRARAAALSMIPTTTGAAKAIFLVIPELKGKMDGLAIRVPTPNVSVIDLVCEVEKDTTREEVNAALKKAADGRMKGVLSVCDEPLVSKDFSGSTYSSIVDAELTNVMDKRLVKVIAWYDNEWGYSLRCVDLALYMASKLMGSAKPAAATAKV